MKYCSNCGLQNSATAKFCSKCGNPLIANDSQPIGKNAPKQDNAVLSDREFLNSAIAAYKEEYAAFRKKWTICIAVGC
ncbi:MAG: zinc-ribbon domain-containing protein, partial [Kiritimatiellae bacterium]|nr:zinc-ribbon domain-containing protein [Kiritimatiellia bacterium]